jgi:thiol-disulfide isomerase/thioredoxin
MGITIAVLLAGCAMPPDGEQPVPTDSAAPALSEDTAEPSGAAIAPEESAEADPVLAFELVEVRTGETFSLAELATNKPVLVETMAIWCTTCLSQQREVVRAHELGDFHSVGIDVDPNERAPDLAEYAEREGFDWRFAVADRELVRLLTDRFGFQVTNPPSTPTFIVSGGTIRALDFNRVRSAEELIDELTAG